MVRLLRVLLFGLALTLASHLAVAGSLHVRDTASLLSSSDVTTIDSSVRGYPFDVLILTSSDSQSKEDFDRRVASAVKADAIVVGIDEQHRHTAVRFGTKLGIDPNQFQSIEQAGSTFFRQKEWRAGIVAIISRASQNTHVGSAGATSPSPTSSQPRTGVNTGFLVT